MLSKDDLARLLMDKQRNGFLVLCHLCCQGKNQLRVDVTQNLGDNPEAPRTVSRRLDRR